MPRILTVAAALAIFTGCIIVESDYDDDEYDAIEVIETVNFAPQILDAWAGCYWDNAYGDEIWYFEAVVDDYDGPADISMVWADVYDEWSGDYVQSFELFPTTDPQVWFSDWLGSSTWLSCSNPNLTVDFVAYDYFDDFDIITVSANTY